jgi:PTH1 family peptidyl-tRNA hydrolase
MNISGPSVLSALRKSLSTTPQPTHLILIHDSLEHTPLTLSYKFSGSANGHNGVKSVIASLQSTSFHRFRIGIGRDAAYDPAHYVLSKLPPEEREFWSAEGMGMDVVLREIEKVVRMSSG